MSRRDLDPYFHSAHGTNDLLHGNESGEAENEGKLLQIDMEFRKVICGWFSIGHPSNISLRGEFARTVGRV